MILDVAGRLGQVPHQLQMMRHSRDPSLAVLGGPFVDSRVPLTSGVLLSCIEAWTLHPLKRQTSEKKAGKRPRGAELGS